MEGAGNGGCYKIVRGNLFLLLFVLEITSTQLGGLLRKITAFTGMITCVGLHCYVFIELRQNRSTVHEHRDESTNLNLDKISNTNILIKTD